MPPSSISIDGEQFDPTIRHFCFPHFHHIADMSELMKLRQLPNLTSATFTGTMLNDDGLEHVSHVATLENLNLQDTAISDLGLACLARLPRLSCLRLKANPQLTNASIPHLLRLPHLVELQIHETSIDQHGLPLLEALTELRDLCLDVWNGNYTFESLLAFSSRMPHCTILAKGRGAFLAGTFDGTWAD